MEFELISQFAILILGGLAIWLVSSKKDYSKWGFVIGLISQPFWIYTTFSNKQYGMFVLSLWYTFGWTRGIYNNFKKNGKEEI